jgi:hypothetical protein
MLAQDRGSGAPPPSLEAIANAMTQVSKARRAWPRQGPDRPGPVTNRTAQTRGEAFEESIAGFRGA